MTSKLERSLLDAAGHRAIMVRLLTAAARETGHHVARVFTDWVCAAANALAAQADDVNKERREADYMAIVRQYDRHPEVIRETFPKLFARCTIALECKPHDLLGSLFHELGANSSHLGQFFTPYEASRLISEISWDESFLATVKEQGYVTIHEPASGSGGMIIAASEMFQRRGLNPQTQLVAHCSDLSAHAVHMTYVQLSLLGLPALVRHQNALTLEAFDELPTWRYSRDLWRYREAAAPLRHIQGGDEQEPVSSEPNEASAVDSSEQVASDSRVQLGLFQNIQEI